MQWIVRRPRTDKSSSTPFIRSSPCQPFILVSAGLKLVCAFPLFSVHSKKARPVNKHLFTLVTPLTALKGEQRNTSVMVYQHHPLPVSTQTVFNGCLVGPGYVLDTTHWTLQSFGATQGNAPECTSTSSILGLYLLLTIRCRSEELYIASQCYWNPFGFGILQASRPSHDS